MIWKDLPIYRGVRRCIKAGSPARVIGLFRSEPIVTVLHPVGEWDASATQYFAVRWENGTETNIARSHLSTKLTKINRRKATEKETA